MTAIPHPPLRRRSAFAAALLCGLLATPCAPASAPAAATEQTPAAGLDELCAALEQGNPTLRQAWLQAGAARLAVPQAEALPGAQFSLSEQANTGGPFDFNRDSGFYAYYSITQLLPWFGKRSLAAGVAAAQADAAGYQYQALKLNLLSQLRLAFYQVGALQDRLRFMDEDLRRLQQIAEVARVRYAVHAAAYVDYLNAQVAVSSQQNDRYALEAQVQSGKEQINTLIGRPSQTPLQLRGGDEGPRLPDAPLDQLIAQAHQANPAVAGERAEVDAADRGVALARKAFWPDLALSAGSYADPSVVQLQTMRMYSVGVSVSLPSWGFRKEQAGLDQAQAQLQAAQAGQQAAVQQIEAGVASAYRALDTALHQLDFTRQRLLPQAEAAYRVALTAYANDGGTGFTDLLQAQSGLRDTELAQLGAENAALQAYTALVAAIGRQPE